METSIKQIVRQVIQKIYKYPLPRMFYWYLRAPFSNYAAFCFYQERTARDLRTNGEYRVLHGPYQGMLYTRHGSSVCLSCLLGTYEMEVWPVIESLKSANYDLVVDVGCAEGYHACGIAKITNKKVMAFDMLETARHDCAEMASLNQLTDLVVIGSFLEHKVLQDLCESQKVFVLCDIDFAEKELLDLNLVPSLSKADLLVETHGYKEGGPEDTLPLFMERFKETHDITLFPMLPRFPHRMWDFVEGGPDHRFVINNVVDEPLCHAFFEGRGLNNWLWLKAKSN